MLIQLLILIFTSLVSIAGYSRPLISSTEITTQEFHNFLLMNPNYESFTDHFKNEFGAIDSQITTLFYQCEKNRGDKIKLKNCVGEILQLLHYRFLTDGLKNLFIETLNLSGEKFNEDLFNTKNSLFIEGSSEIKTIESLLISNLDSDDEVYVNGFQLSKSEISSLKIKEHDWIHLQILSNKYEPYTYVGPAKSITYQKKALLKGSCDGASILISENNYEDYFTKIDFHGLFNNKCLAAAIPIKASLSSTNLQNGEPENLSFQQPKPLTQQLNSTNSIKKFYEKKEFWIGLAIGSILLYNINKNYFNSYDVIFEY